MWIVVDEGEEPVTCDGADYTQRRLSVGQEHDGRLRWLPYIEFCRNCGAGQSYGGHEAALKCRHADSAAIIVANAHASPRSET